MATIIGVGYHFFAKDDLSPTVNRIGRSIDAASANLAIMEHEMARVGGIAGRWGRSLSGASDRIVDGMKNAVMQASSLESQMMGVARTTRLPDAQLRQLEDRLLTMSDTLPLSALELGKVAIIAGQMGVAMDESGKLAADAVPKISQLAFTSAQAARAFGMSEFGAARSLAILSNVFQENIKDADKLASTVAALSAGTVATADEIVNAASRMGALVKSMGASTEEGLAWAAAIREVGGRARQGATAISLLYTQSQLKAGKFAAQMGLTTAEFQKKFQENATGTLMQFLGTLGQIEATKVPGVLKSLGLQSRAAQAVLLPMAKNMNKVSKAMNIAYSASAGASKGMSELGRQFGTMTKGLGPALATLRGSIQNLIIRAGRPLLGLATWLINVMVEVIAIIGKIPAPILTLGLVVAGLSAGVLALAGVVLSLASAFIFAGIMAISFKRAIQQSSIALAGMSVETQMLVWDLRMLGSQWQASIVGFFRGGWRTALSGAKGHLLKFWGVLKGMSLTDMFAKVGMALKWAATSAGSLATTIGGGLLTALQAVGGWLVGTLMPALVAAAPVILKIAIVAGVLYLAWKALKAIWSYIGPSIISGLTAVYDLLKMTWTAFSAEINPAINNFGAVMADLGELLYEMFSGVMGFFGEILFGTDEIGSAWKGFVAFWKKNVLPTIRDYGRSVNKVFTFIRQGINLVGYSIGYVVGLIEGAFRKLSENPYMAKVIDFLSVASEASANASSFGLLGGMKAILGRLRTYGQTGKEKTKATASATGAAMVTASAGATVGEAGAVVAPVKAEKVEVKPVAVTPTPSTAVGAAEHQTRSAAPIQTVTVPSMRFGDIVVPVTVMLDGREVYSATQRASMENQARNFMPARFAVRGVG